MPVNYQVDVFYPNQGDSIVEQLSSCLKNWKAKIGKNNIIKQTIFIKLHPKDNYIDIKKELIAIILEQLSFLPPTSIISQQPEAKYDCVLEVTYVSFTEDLLIVQKKTENGSQYINVDCNNYTMIIGGGLQLEGSHENLFDQVNYSFGQMEQIMAMENFGYEDIVRQWNYVQDIYNCTSDGSSNYQIFNDIRSVFYQKALFTFGYPAATGIGISAGGFVLDFIAVKPKNGFKVLTLNNPVQVDAHKYTPEVLLDNNMMDFDSKTTPKFERAKCIGGFNKGLIYVSGTAAIKGQHTVNSQNVEMQTKVTIENISILLSEANLKIIGLVFSTLKLHQARVYVKNHEDIPIVKKICNELLNCNDSLFINGGICREDLLVEIEAIYQYY